MAVNILNTGQEGEGENEDIWLTPHHTPTLKECLNQKLPATAGMVYTNLTNMGITEEISLTFIDESDLNSLCDELRLSFVNKIKFKSAIRSLQHHTSRPQERDREKQIAVEASPNVQRMADLLNIAIKQSNDTMNSLKQYVHSIDNNMKLFMKKMKHTLGRAVTDGNYATNTVNNMQSKVMYSSSCADPSSIISHTIYNNEYTICGSSVISNPVPLGFHIHEGIHQKVGPLQVDKKQCPISTTHVMPNTQVPMINIDAKQPTDNKNRLFVRVYYVFVLGIIINFLGNGNNHMNNERSSNQNHDRNDDSNTSDVNGNGFNDDYVFNNGKDNLHDDDNGDDDEQGHLHLHPHAICDHVHECKQCCDKIRLLEQRIAFLEQDCKARESCIETMDNMLQHGDESKCCESPLSERKNKRKKKKPKRKKRSVSLNEASYEPPAANRAKGNIKISQQLTDEIIPNVAKERVSNVYDFVDKTIAMQHNDKHVVYHHNKEHSVINLDLRHKQTGERLFAVIKRNESNKNRIYKDVMMNKVFTASELKSFSECRLPDSSRKKFQEKIKNDTDAIRNYLKIPQNVEKIVPQKWTQSNIEIYNKPNNVQRIVLNVTPEKWTESVSYHLKVKRDVNEKRIIPILMFRNKSHWIEYIVVVDSYSFGSIGLSLTYDAKKGVKVRGVHLDWNAIKASHELCCPSHVNQCVCFNGIDSMIDDIHIGNPDDLLNQLKDSRSRYQSVNNLLHRIKSYAAQCRNELHSNAKRCTGYRSSSPSSVQSPSYCTTNSDISSHSPSPEFSLSSYNSDHILSPSVFNKTEDDMDQDANIIVVNMNQT